MYQSFIRTSDRYRAYIKRPWVRLLGWIAAGLLFAVAATVALLSLPDEIDLDYRYLLLALLVVPFDLLLTSLEIPILGRMSGTQFQARKAITLTISGALANLTPLPGSVAVRVNAVVQSGGAFRKAVRGNLAIGLVWISVSLVLGALAVSDQENSTWFFLLMLFGLVAVGLSLITMKNHLSVSLMASLFVLEAAIILVGALRVYLAIGALGYEPSLDRAIVLTMSSILATATGVFPAGLGLSELFAALTAPLTGWVPSVAVVVMAVSRLIRLVGLAMASQIMAVFSSIRKQDTVDQGGDDRRRTQRDH